VDDVTPEWLETFSLDRYRAMAGLLSGDDFEFLSRQPGFDGRLYRKLRRERLSIFRGYLHCLIADFNKLHATARFLVAHSVEDRSDLATRLISIQWSFKLNVMKVYFQFLLCHLGSRTVDVHTLLGALEAISTQLAPLGVPQTADLKPLGQLV
jgi:hypothetical protein